MKSRLLGILILLTVIVGAIFFKLYAGSEPKVVLKGMVGGEKTGLFEDTEIKEIFHNQYGIAIDYSKSGSIDMVLGDVKGQDFLFPSSQIAEEMFKEQQKQKIVKSQTVLSSPIVIYSWDEVTKALEQQGIVKKHGNSYYIVDFPKLVEMLTEGKKWSEIGLPQLYGSMTIKTTDPQKSNSGNMFLGLLATMLNKGELVRQEDIPKVMPTIQKFYAKQGYLQDSSSDLFEQYLKTGMGANPMIVGYENQIVEFAKKNPEAWAQVKGKVRILYPTPTIWSEHPMMALNERSVPLIQAMQNEKIQQIAWEQYGFRTGPIGVKNDPKVLDIVGIPAEINQVIPVPQASVMEQLMKELK